MGIGRDCGGDAEGQCGVQCAQNCFVSKFQVETKKRKGEIPGLTIRGGCVSCSKVIVATTSSDIVAVCSPVVVKHVFAVRAHTLATKVDRRRPHKGTHTHITARLSNESKEIILLRLGVRDACVVISILTGTRDIPHIVYHVMVIRFALCDWPIFFASLRNHSNFRQIVFIVVYPILVSSADVRVCVHGVVVSHFSWSCV